MQQIVLCYTLSNSLLKELSNTQWTFLHPYERQNSMVASQKRNFRINSHRHHLVELKKVHFFLNISKSKINICFLETPCIWLPACATMYAINSQPILFNIFSIKDAFGAHLELIWKNMSLCQELLFSHYCKISSLITSVPRRRQSLLHLLPNNLSYFHYVEGLCRLGKIIITFNIYKSTKNNENVMRKTGRNNICFIKSMAE